MLIAALKLHLFPLGLAQLFRKCNGYHGWSQPCLVKRNKQLRCAMRRAVPHRPRFLHPPACPPAAPHHVAGSTLMVCTKLLYLLHRRRGEVRLHLGGPRSTVSCREWADKGGRWSLGSTHQWHNNMEEKQRDRRRCHGDVTGLGSAVVAPGGSGVSRVIRACMWLCTVWTCLQSISQTCPKSGFCLAASPGIHSIWKNLLNYTRKNWPSYN